MATVARARAQALTAVSFAAVWNDGDADRTAPCWGCGGASTPASELSNGYFRCATCGLTFQPERSTVETHELYGDEYFEELRANVDAYGDNLADRAHEADVRLRFVRRMARSGRLLEIGVAEGHFLTQARESGFDVCGVEPAPETAAASRASGLPVVQGFIEDVALPEEPFNVVCAWHVLEHLVEPLRGLSRIHEALTPDGLLFAEVPNIESDLASRAGQTWPHLQPQYHVCHYGPVALRTVLYRASFDLIELSTVPIFGYYRRAVRFRPTMVVAHVRQSAALGVIPFRGHPTKHELLRVVARVRR